MRHDPTPVGARAAILAVLPSNGSAIGYPVIALAGGNDAGAVVGDLLADGLMEVRTIEGALHYALVMPDPAP